MKYKNTKKQGDAGLGAAIGFFTERGNCVSVPLTDSQEYDLIVDEDEVLKKVQVKTTNSKSPHGIFQVELRTTGGNKSRQIRTLFEAAKVNYLFILTGDGERYLIPAVLIESKGQINLGPRMQGFRV